MVKRGVKHEHRMVWVIIFGEKTQVLECVN